VGGGDPERPAAPSVRPQSTPSKVGLAEGAKGPDVAELQRYLARFGYLQPNPSRATEPEVREFDNATASALAHFQKFYKLRQTGTLTQATVALMARPRCGMPDVNPPGVRGYVAQGSKWTTTSLNYAFFNHCADLTILETETAVAAGLGWWAAHSPLTFTPVLIGAAHELEAEFATGAHGCGYDFDGVGGVLAHCFWPPPGGGSLAGHAHFDDDDTFTAGGGDWDLASIAGHEYGHGLGLDHSQYEDALMWAYMLGTHSDLSADDIAGIQAIYPGEVEPPVDPGGTLPDVPAGVSATALSTSAIQIAWSAASGATSYVVGVADTGAGPFPSMDTTAGTSLDATGLAPATTKYYVVRSVNAAGTSADSAAVNATTHTGISDPGGGEWAESVLKSYRLTH
jgi:hypothetical protein